MLFRGKFFANFSHFLLMHAVDAQILQLNESKQCVSYSQLVIAPTRRNELREDILFFVREEMRL